MGTYLFILFYFFSASFALSQTDDIKRIKKLFYDLALHPENKEKQAQWDSLATKEYSRLKEKSVNESENEVYQSISDIIELIFFTPSQMKEQLDALLVLEYNKFLEIRKTKDPYLQRAIASGKYKAIVYRFYTALNDCGNYEEISLSLKEVVKKFKNQDALFWGFTEDSIIIPGQYTDFYPNVAKAEEIFGLYRYKDSKSGIDIRAPGNIVFDGQGNVVAVIFGYPVEDKFELTPLKQGIQKALDNAIAQNSFNDLSSQVPFVLNNVHFHLGKAELLTESFSELDTLAEYLIKNKTNKLQITGHTDNAGEQENNQKLSEERAKAVADYLVKKGIDRNRLVIKGFGSTRPIADNTTEEGRAKNRRVEIRIE